MYAKSQVKESERGTSVEISPEDGSNLAVTAYGFTEQAGTGDPSPSNVRALTNGGLKLVKLVLTGSEDISDGTNLGSVTRVIIKPGILAPSDYSIVYCTDFKRIDGWSNNSPHVYVLTYPYMFVPNEYLQSSGAAGVKAWLAARYAAGDPVIVWYQPADESQATGLYAPIILSSGEYRATCLPLTAPLCEGDSVVSWARSGCDKVLVLDGTQSLTWTQNSTAPYGGFFTVGAPNALQSVIGTIAQILSDRLTPIQNVVTSIASGTAFFSSAGGKVNFTLFGQKSVEDANAYLSQNPITIWYRSTNYTEAADIPVSLETHQQAVLVLDGTENFQLLYGDNTFVWEANKAAKGDQTILRDHYKGVNTGWASLQNNQIQMVTNGRYIGAKDTRFSAAAEFKAHLATQYAAGTPVTIVYQLATPITYAHPGVDIISNINESGSIVVSGQKEVSISYHKSLNKTIIELDNKSYSKQESHNIFARALRGTTEAAKSITIYPDTESNVIATINGFTKQSGSGDASPVNVRSIVNGGNLFMELDLTKAKSNAGRDLGDGWKQFGLPLSIVGSNSQVSYKGYCSCLKMAVDTSGKYEHFYIESNTMWATTKHSSAAEIENFLKLKKAVLWVVPTNTEKVTGLYVNFSGTGDGYTGVCAKLTAPLCQGDKLVTKVKSGCDKKIIVDGETTKVVDGGPTYFNIAIGNKGAAGSRVYKNYGGGIYNSGANLQLNREDFGIYGRTPDDFNSYCKSNPLEIWYKTIDYDPKIDKDISVERHSRAVIRMTGTEGITLYWNGRKDEQLAKNRITFSWPMPYPYKSASEYSSTVSHFKFLETITSGMAVAVGYQFAASRNIYVCLDLSTIDAVGETDDTTLRNKILQYLATQYSSGTPVTIEYQVMSELVYAHDPVEFIASPDEEGAWVIAGMADGTVSAEYNKDITYAFNELQSAVLSAIANLSL